MLKLRTDKNTITELCKNIHGSVEGANTIAVKKGGRDFGGSVRFRLLSVGSQVFLNEQGY